MRRATTLLADDNQANANCAERGKWSEADTELWTQADSLRTGPRVKIQSMGRPLSKKDAGVVRDGCLEKAL